MEVKELREENSLKKLLETTLSYLNASKEKMASCPTLHYKRQLDKTELRPKNITFKELIYCFTQTPGFLRQLSVTNQL